jgi:diaminohydroxyphosphoribosylaminopyrimidine deaminase/5-amino-6-(5-phosphoribosylamino)uracil reductase
MQGINPEILKEICEVKMPFGKHAGIILADLPINYLEWFHRQGMPKGKLGMQLSTIYEIKINAYVGTCTTIPLLPLQAMNTHEQYMQRCLQLALKGLGSVSPNPMVGCVIVHDDKIIGEGYHQKYGEGHAEVNAIDSVKDKSLLSKSTIYVSLEPCNHFGKTPPCADLILKHAIPNVVIGIQDPFEKVNGSGIKKLSDSGVEVITGILQKEAIELNKRFFTFHQQKRPYIILKWAQSENQSISGFQGKPVKISNALTDILVHKWRSEEAAIMVGTKTVILDNPSLNTRNWPGKNPIRICFDRNLKIEKSAKILDQTSPTIILNQQINKIEGVNDFIQINFEREIIPQINELLYQKNVQSIIIEGGAKLLQTYIDAEVWDEARVITNQTLVIENGIASPNFENTTFFKQEKIENDLIQYFSNPKTNKAK